jgi:hypothetical protein
MVLRRGGRERNTNTVLTYKYTKAKRGNPEQQVAKMNWELRRRSNLFVVRMQYGESWVPFLYKTKCKGETR